MSILACEKYPEAGEVILLLITKDTHRSVIKTQLPSFTAQLEPKAMPQLQTHPSPPAGWEAGIHHPDRDITSKRHRERTVMDVSLRDPSQGSQPFLHHELGGAG